MRRGSKVGQVVGGAYMDRCMHGYMDDWMNQWMDIWMDIWMDGWLILYSDDSSITLTIVYLYVCISVCISVYVSLCGWMDGWMDVVDSVPLDYKTAREAEMEARLTQMGDLLLTQVAAMRERLDGVSDRVIATENECLTIAPAVQDKLSKSTMMVKEALNESIKSIRHDMNAMFKSKDDELYQMYEELCKLQRELSSHQSAVSQTTLDGIELSNLTRSRLLDLENSIIATDDLLTEQVNDIIGRLEVLTTNYSHSAQLAASNAVGGEEEAVAVAKRLADMEHRIASNAATIKLRSTELEVMVNKNNADLLVCSSSYNALSNQLIAIATEILGVDGRLRAVEEVNGKQQEVNDEHRRSVDATREQLRSHNEVVTLYINNNIADVKGSLMDLYNNTIASYVHIDDYSSWKDSIERVLTDYSYSIQSNADRIDSCDAVVNDVQSSYSDHQVYIEALVTALRKDLDDLSSSSNSQHQHQQEHRQEQVHRTHQLENESLRRLNEMVAEIQLIKPRYVGMQNYSTLLHYSTLHYSMLCYAMLPYY